MGRGSGGGFLRRGSEEATMSGSSAGIATVVLVVPVAGRGFPELA
jgi:hypothetical protein